MKEKNVKERVRSRMKGLVSLLLAISLCFGYAPTVKADAPTPTTKYYFLTGMSEYVVYENGGYDYPNRWNRGHLCTSNLDDIFDSLDDWCDAYWEENQESTSWENQWADFVAATDGTDSIADFENQGSTTMSVPENSSFVVQHCQSGCYITFELNGEALLDQHLMGAEEQDEFVILSGNYQVDFELVRDNNAGNTQLLTINQKAENPQVTTSSEVTIEPGTTSTVPVTVTASVSDGGSLSYQWYKNTTASTTGGTLISGATSATYSAPTTEVGTTYYYCKVKNTITVPHQQNGEVYTDEAEVASSPIKVDVHAHSFGAWKKFNENQHCRECSCGEKQYEDHAWGKGVVTKKATPTSKGVKTYTCSVCHATKTESIPKTAKYTNTLTVSKVNGSVYSVANKTLKKKAQSFKIKKVLRVSKARGKVTYKKVSASSKINKYVSITKDGTVKLKKAKVKKGTYTVKVKVTAAGDKSYKSKSVTKTFKIKVK